MFFFSFYLVSFQKKKTISSLDFPKTPANLYREEFPESRQQEACYLPTVMRERGSKSGTKSFIFMQVLELHLNDFLS